MKEEGGDTKCKGTRRKKRKTRAKIEDNSGLRLVIRCGPISDIFSRSPFSQRLAQSVTVLMHFSSILLAGRVTLSNNLRFLVSQLFPGYCYEKGWPLFSLRW
jgi:hypothetical protein